METVIKKHLDVEKIERIARENKYDKKAYKYFLEEIKKNLNKELFLGFTDKSEECIINKVVEFLREVEVYRKKGYDFEWAAEYVYRIHRPEKAHAAAFAYLAAENAQDSNELKDLKLYAKLNGKDENFVDYFSILLVEPDYTAIFNEPIEEIADYYSDTIKKKIAEGKSAPYAKYYAFFSTSFSYPPYRCHIAGMEAEKADNYDLDDSELTQYSEDISRYIYDNFDVYEDSLTDKEVDRMRNEFIEDL